MNNIYFLGFWDNIKDNVGIAVEGMLRGIFYSICSVIYKMIYYFYNVFEVLCNGQLLESSEISELFGRVSMLLGFIMLFRVAFSFIQALIDPDSGLNDKEKGIPNVIKKVVIVIIMFGVSGYLFDLARDIQVLVIKENVISKLLLPQEVNDESFGGALAANLFTTFYNINPAVDPSTFNDSTTSSSDYQSMGTIGGNTRTNEINQANAVSCVSEDYINTLRQNIKEKNDYSYMRYQCISVTGVYTDENGEVTNDDEFVIEFNFIFCLLVGIAVLWFLINYCLSVGIRVIQLTVLQILAPIAFVGYLEPKSDNMFSKWLNIYISTYVDVFIRMGIISFVCYICALIMQGWNDGSGVFWRSVGNPTGFTAKVIGIFMILALFQFAKKAPNLLKNILPVGSSGLSFGTNRGAFKPLEQGLGYGVRAAGAVGGAAAFGLMSAGARYKDNKALRQGRGAVGSALGGLGSGMLRGLKYGGKKGNLISNLRSGFSEQVARDDEVRDLYAKGGSRRGQISAGLQNMVGTDRGTRDQTLINNAKKVEEPLAKMFELAENSSSYKKLMEQKTTELRNGNYAAADSIQERADAFKNAFVDASLNGSIQNGNPLSYSVTDAAGNVTNYTDGVSGGDRVKGNTILTNYVGAMTEINQINPSIIDDGGNVVGTFHLGDPGTVGADALDTMIKEAQRTQSNVMRQDGYRAGQANMSNRKSK